jgi:poly(A) polymerase
VRFQEDPVRMLRAVALAARLGFTIERDTLEAIRTLRGEIVKSSPARLLDEIYKILRQGASRKTFEMLHQVGLLAYLLPEADETIEADGGERLLGSLGRLDDYRNAGLATPDDLTSPLLMGSLLVPLGLPLRRAVAAPPRPDPGDPPEEPIDVAGEMEALGGDPEEPATAHPAPPSLVPLPFARRDADRLRLILAAQGRLREVHTSPRVKHLLAGRGYLEEALRWLEIHGGVQGQELAADWRALRLDEEIAPISVDVGSELPPAPRRRRRRRRRRRPGAAPSRPTES